MKRNTLLFALLFVGLMSCNDTPNNQQPDEAYISLPNNLSLQGDIIDIDKKESVVESIKFENLALSIATKTSAEGSHEWCQENIEYVNTVKEGVKRCNNGSAYIISRIYPHYIYGMTRSLKIYADTTLWGIEAGEDLSANFLLYEENLPLISYQNGIPFREMAGGLHLAGNDLRRLDQALIPNSLVIQTKSVPDEKPQMITLSIVMHIAPNDIIYEILYPTIKLDY